MRFVTVTPGQGIESLAISDGPVPVPGRAQVLVRLRAASLNFRDLMVADGMYPGLPGGPMVPLSDGAGEIAEVGPGCTEFAVGDRVAATFSQSWIGGRCTTRDTLNTLGGAVPGVLSQYRAFDESGIVKIPDSLSFAEAATLPCAALTAWNALQGLRGLLPGETVLCLGTGGVATFALQFARAAGARVIVTSSSDAKLAKAKALGADHGINYHAIPEWDKSVLDLTAGEGVDLVVETGGPGTLARSIACTRREGSVQMIGVLSLGTIDPMPILTGGIIVRGVMIGSREMFHAMNAAIVQGNWKPVIDRSFEFSAVREAYSHLKSATHFGKVVMTIE